MYRFNLLLIISSILLVPLFGFAQNTGDGAVLIDDFEDGDIPGWQVVGHGPLMGFYTAQAETGGVDSAFCLRLTMNTKDGWCGVQIPQWRTAPVVSPTAISLDARGGTDCAQLLVDLHQSDGARYWCLTSFTAQGQWQHVEVRAANFFPVDNTDATAHPFDLSKIGAIWLTLYQTSERGTQENPPPATLDIDNVSLIGTPVATIDTTSFSAPAQHLDNLTILVADTSNLPKLGQDRDAPTRACEVLQDAGAIVKLVQPGKLDLLQSVQNTVLAWEGPACNEADWPEIQAYLRKGGKLFWWGASLPFSRPVADDGTHLPFTETPAKLLSQSTFHGLHPLQAESSLTITEAGKDAWPEAPEELQTGKCRYLTLDDSTSLQTHWPWVEMTPLLTLRYSSRNWVSLNDLFTGSVATLFSHHAGEFSSAQVLLATVGNGRTSPLSPENPLFAHTLTDGIKLAAQPVEINTKPLDIKVTAPPVSRETFFNHSGGVFGALDFGVRTWQDPAVLEAGNLLGMNVMVAGIPWLSDPAPDGSVIDWEVSDRLLADAEKAGWKVIFDGYCFGYGQFKWACEGPDGASAHPGCNYNPIFRQRFNDAMKALVSRYRDNSNLVAIFATPDTGTLGFYLDTCPLAQTAWREYASKHNLPEDLPVQPQAGSFDLSPARAGYVNFWDEIAIDFASSSIETIRAIVPEMPILLRGVWLDVATSFRLAAKYRNVAPHCECIETSHDVEAGFRGFAQRYQVPISGENGWPKAREAALRMACATTLMGGYNDLLFSFGGPILARPGYNELQQLLRLWPELKGAKYTPAQVGLLIPDTTIWASEPPSFMSAQGRPHLEPLMEQSGISFMAVSAQWPKLDGLQILIDDGRNDVLCPDSRTEILNWVRDNGGILIAFEHTGRFDAAGDKTSLASEAKLTFSVGTHPLGKGEIVVLPAIRTDARSSEGQALFSLLKNYDIAAPVSVEPLVNQAYFTKNDRSYLVLYHKYEELVGSFFTESRYDETTLSLPSEILKISLPTGMQNARELVTGEVLTVTRDAVELELPATHWRVIEFTP